MPTYNLYLVSYRMAHKPYMIVLFEDGLQIIPHNWFNQQLNTAKWPNFLSNQRYYEAVKFMAEPQSSWGEHPILKIYGTYGKQC